MDGKLNLRACTVLAALSAAAPAFAATQYGDHVSLSGFGTLGAVTSDNSTDAFVRDGAPSGANGKPSWKVDSKLGVQLDAKVNDWLSGAVQVLAEQRYKPEVTAQFEWAFVKVKPMDGMTVRLGRIAPAVFMISDSRNVGYANTWVRPPNEVYNLAGVKKLTGGDVSYRFDLGGTSLTASAMAGNGRFNSVNADLEAKDLQGLNVVWDTSYGSFRLGRVQSAVQVGAVARPGSPPVAHYVFSGLGYQFDNGDYVFNTEYVMRKSREFKSGDAKGWYLMGGTRFGAFMPYAFMADTNNSDASSFVNGEQRTLALGVRWDVVTSAAIKLQVERADPKDTMGISFTPPARPPAPVREKTNALSLVVDFVF
jgi:hypothetical protein